MQTNSVPTATLKVAVSELNLRREPSSSGGASTAIRVLPKGTEVTLTGYASRDPDWCWVKTQDGTEGFLKRMLLTQADVGGLVVPSVAGLAAYNSAVWSATQTYDGVTYKLGAKDPTTGRVDCSGWIAFINRLAFNAVNTSEGRRVFGPDVLKILNTHSDHQLSIPGYKTGQLFSGDEVSRIAWRPGLLIGINYSDYDWELNQGRVFEIDHIVQTVTNEQGKLYVSQSSSGGGGVNNVRLDGWLGSIEGLRSRNRVHVVDIFGLASVAPQVDIETNPADLVLPELDTSSTPAG